MKHNKKIKDVISNIKKMIKDKGKYIWYVAIDDDIKLISTGKTKKEAKEVIYDKVSEDKKFIGLTFYLVTMTVNKDVIGNNSFTKPGAFSIFTSKYHLNKKNKLISDDSFGTIWFSDENIMNYGFKTSFFKTILNEIHEDKVSVNIVDMTTFDKFM